MAFSAGRVAAAVASLADVDLVSVGEAPTCGARVRLPQRGKSFGERLASAFADARSLGYEVVVAVPTDVPELDSATLGRAFALLERSRAVLGPSPDGGVYLIGLASSVSAPSSVRWQTPFVLGDLKSGLVRTGITPALLPELADVDDRGDLVALALSARDVFVRAFLRGLLTHDTPQPLRVPRLAMAVGRRPRGARSPPRLLPSA